LASARRQDIFESSEQVCGRTRRTLTMPLTITVRDPPGA
jgi:hypothetical protein